MAGTGYPDTWSDTENVRWKVAVPGNGNSSPIVWRDQIIFTNDLGETFVVAAGREFKLLHVNRLSGRTLASPALVDGTWYFRTATELIAIGRT